MKCLCRVFLLSGLFAVFSTDVDADSHTVQLPQDLVARYEEGSETTFRLEQGQAAGDAAKLIMAVLNYFGNQKQVLEGLKSDEAMVKSLLDNTHLPGVLIYVEQQTSQTEVSHTALVGDKPLVIGPGIGQVKTWQAYTTNGNNDFHPKVQEGFIFDEEASYFVWAQEVNGRITYGMTIPASAILNEARRNISDEKLRQVFSQEYDSQLLGELVKQIEQRASEKPLKEQAERILEERKTAIEETQRVDKELNDALERAARAQKVSIVFETLAQVLTVAQLSANLAAEFPDQSDKIDKATTTTDLKTILDNVATQAQKQQAEMSGKLQLIQDRQRNIRLEQLQIIRLEKVDTNSIPGVLP